MVRAVKNLLENPQESRRPVNKRVAKGSDKAAEVAQGTTEVQEGKERILKDLQAVKEVGQSRRS